MRSRQPSVKKILEAYLFSKTIRESGLICLTIMTMAMMRTIVSMMSWIIIPVMMEWKITGLYHPEQKCHSDHKTDFLDNTYFHGSLLNFLQIRPVKKLKS